MKFLKNKIFIGATALILTTFFIIIWSGKNFAPSQPLPVFGAIKPFSLVSQDNKPFSLSNLKGKIWVVDFIFTSCHGPCPLMTRQMKQLQEHYVNSPDVHFLSISIDPQTDTPQVLKRYAQKFSANFSKWTFLTGDLKTISLLARNSFKLSSGTPENPSLHTTKFVLLDRSGQIRGYYDSQDSLLLEKIKADIQKLQKQKPHSDL
ncbi:MAG: SCO family protein [Bdellovibrio sp.]|nr:MAG: SCO family protein [Bdellovibrio sp.]